MTEAALPRAQAVPAQKLAVADRPRLAPGIELRGEMSESAYKSPPWLIERDGMYIPVSKLLYAVAEQATGSQTLDDIADVVSDRIERNVTADDIRVVMANLIRSGIVANADGSVVSSAVAAMPTPSPLAVNMRMKMLSPGLIDVASRGLQVLFWPPVVLAVLLIGAAAQGWMYFIHGIGGGLHDALYAPGFVLLILTAIVLAAGFHEFGHAAALRYAGGRAKNMGVGFYLFYPAFYTDVTDNYRLSRWARLRTDLGGFYFHLIFALGAIGLYVASGWEPLLLIVVLINLEIIHQLMPFVRLDGYWVLADMTGIPDFFSHMGPFLRSLVPFWKGKSQMPELKTWAKVVFLIYILITIPVLLFVLVHLLAGLPRIMGTAFDSFGQQWIAVQGAMAQGDALSVAGSVVQMLVLGLMTGGLVFFLFTLARSAFRKGWEWSRPTWPRRLAGGLATVALAAVLVVLFAPAMPLTGGQGALSGAFDFSPIRPDEPFTFQDMTRQLLTGERTTGPGTDADAAGAPEASVTSSPVPTAAAETGTTPSPTATATPGLSATPTPVPTPTPAASAEATATPSPTPTTAPSATPTPTASGSPSPTGSPAAFPGT